jgi:hypothetical protein
LHIINIKQLEIMGRYYSGDIEGKFWFGVQSSVAADRFGVSHNEPNYVEYYYEEEDLEKVEEEIQVIEETLGDKLQLIENFFAEKNSYNDDELTEAGISRDDLSEYADLRLGKQIRDCIKENGSCNFTAEL